MTTLLEPQNDFIASIYDEMARQMGDSRDSIVQANETAAEIRKAYKKLIKVLHPDMNGGDRSQEEQLQEVMWAWDQVKDSRSFK